MFSLLTVIFSIIQIFNT